MDTKLRRDELMKVYREIKVKVEAKQSYIWLITNIVTSGNVWWKLYFWQAAKEQGCYKASQLMILLILNAVL